jgi:hypothetical protein
MSDDRECTKWDRDLAGVINRLKDDGLCGEINPATDYTFESICILPTPCSIHGKRGESDVTVHMVANNCPVVGDDFLDPARHSRSASRDQEQEKAIIAESGSEDEGDTDTNVDDKMAEPGKDRGRSVATEGLADLTESASNGRNDLPKGGEADGRGKRHDSPDITEPRSDPLVPLLEKQIRDGVGIFRKDAPGPSEDVVESVLRRPLYHMDVVGWVMPLTGDERDTLLSGLTRLRSEMADKERGGIEKLKYIQRLETEITRLRAEVERLKGALTKIKRLSCPGPNTAWLHGHQVTTTTDEIYAIATRALEKEHPFSRPNLSETR